MKKRNNKNLRGGYLLVEAMVAVTVAMVGLMSVITLLSKSLSLNRVAGNRATANYLAAEGIEVVKNLIDSNYLKNPETWNEGIPSSGDYQIDYNTTALDTSYNSENHIIFDSNTGFYGYGVGSETPFTRKVTIQTSADGEEIQVNSIVAWTDRGNANFSVDLEDHFFNWRVITP